MVDPVAASNAFWDLKASELLKLVPESLQFVSQLISALAWPLVVISVVKLFKTQLIALISRLAALKVSGSGLDMQFNEGLDKAAVKVAGALREAESIAANAAPQEQNGLDLLRQDAPHPAEPERGPTALPSDNAADIAGRVGTVLRSWQSVEQKMRSFAVEVAGPELEDLNASQLAAKLFSLGFLGEEFFDTIRELINLRNLAIHSPSQSISEADAARFANITDSVLIGFSTLARGVRHKRIRDEMRAQGIAVPEP